MESGKNSGVMNIVNWIDRDVVTDGKFLPFFSFFLFGTESKERRRRTKRQVMVERPSLGKRKVGRNPDKIFCFLLLHIDVFNVEIYRVTKQELNTKLRTRKYETNTSKKKCTYYTKRS